MFVDRHVGYSALMEPNNATETRDGGGEDPAPAKVDEIVVKTAPGASHVGHPVCEGPGVMRLLVTQPYNSQGRIVEIPVPDIESVSKLADD
jgi:hypothetical protein